MNKRHRIFPKCLILLRLAVQNIIFLVFTIITLNHIISNSELESSFCVKMSGNQICGNPIVLFFLGILIAVVNIELVLAQDFRQAGLTMHNQLRALHKAAPLSFDAALNTAAQNCAQYYAQYRKIDHSCKTPNTGENLYYTTWPAQPDSTDVTKKAIQAWYDENKGYNYQSPSRSIGLYLHFTQLVWKATTKVGFGVATVNGYTVVVGKYAPQGNMYGGGGTDNMNNFRDNVLPK